MNNTKCLKLYVILVTTMVIIMGVIVNGQWSSSWRRTKYGQEHIYTDFSGRGQGPPILSGSVDTVDCEHELIKGCPTCKCPALGGGGATAVHSRFTPAECDEDSYLDDNGNCQPY